MPRGVYVRTPGASRNRPAEPLADRFARYVQKPADDGCWIWTGQRNRHGYGVISGGRRGAGMRMAHRLSWTLHVGLLPDGLFVLHRCDNPPCVNPAHLFLGTQAENMHDMARKGRASRYNAAKTHCIHGHVFSPENTFWCADGKRRCRACANERNRRYGPRRVAVARALRHARRAILTR